MLIIFFQNYKFIFIYIMEEEIDNQDEDGER